MEQYKEKVTEYRMRTKTYQNRSYLVVPVVMMTEGVHNGSHGPIFHQAEELGKFPESWNGIPVTVHHPEQEGQPVSANSPEVLESYQLGMVFNTRLDGKRLKAEAWLDQEKLEQRFPAVKAYIENQQPLDVSLSMFSDEVVREGEWNGETYRAIATNYRPDHLALLPGEVGACSWKDGCGVRNNSEQKPPSLAEQLRAIDLRTLIPEGFQINQISFDETASKIYSVVNSMDRRQGDQLLEAYYLEGVWPGYFIYRKVDRTVSPTKEQLFQQDYVIRNTDDQLEVIGDPVEVKKTVTYTKVNQNVNTNKKSKMSVCKEGRVDALIQNASTQFEESDRDWLMGLSDEALEKLVPQVNKEEPAKPEPPKTVEAYVEAAPAGMKETLQAGLTLYRAHREGIVTNILSGTKEVWTKEQLEVMPMEMLEKIEKSITVPTDYSAAAPGQKAPVQNRQTGSDEVLMPTGY